MIEYIKNNSINVLITLILISIGLQFVLGTMSVEMNINPIILYIPVTIASILLIVLITIDHRPQD